MTPISWSDVAARDIVGRDILRQGDRCFRGPIRHFHYNPATQEVALVGDWVGWALSPEGPWHAWPDTVQVEFEAGAGDPEGPTADQGPAYGAYPQVDDDGRIEFTIPFLGTTYAILPPGDTLNLADTIDDEDDE